MERHIYCPLINTPPPPEGVIISQPKTSFLGVVFDVDHDFEGPRAPKAHLDTVLDKPVTPPGPPPYRTTKYTPVKRYISCILAAWPCRCKAGAPEGAWPHHACVRPSWSWSQPLFLSSASQSRACAAAPARRDTFIRTPYQGELLGLRDPQNRDLRRKPPPETVKSVG